MATAHPPQVAHFKFWIKSDKAMISNKKISQTIMDFGEPILHQLPDDYSRAEFEAAILIVILAWNTVVLDAWNKTDKFERELMERLEQGPIQAKFEVARLLKRKKEMWLY